VVGLYVASPAHAVVLSVDEKSQIQALDRTQPGLPMKKGRDASGDCQNFRVRTGFVMRVSIGLQSAPRIGAQKGPQGASFCSAPAEPILPSRLIYSVSRCAQRRSRTAAVQRPPAGLVLDGREHDGMSAYRENALAKELTSCTHAFRPHPASDSDLVGPGIPI
jgi:hypothetical protein